MIGICMGNLITLALTILMYQQFYLLPYDAVTDKSLQLRSSGAGR
jgi:hypothetical protein